VNVKLKTIVFFFLLIATLLIFASPAYGGGKRAWKIKVAPSPALIEERKQLIATDIVKNFPDGYGVDVIGDPRFKFESRTVARYTPHPQPSQPPIPAPAQPKPRLHDFNYVMTDWAKENGREYLDRYAPIFARGELQFAPVKKEIVGGILDAETQYGEKTSKNDYPIVQTLFTIAVYRPDFQKKGWAEDQLMAFLRISQWNGWDPYLKMGSRTGAFGPPQFEPTSYEQFAMYWNGSECASWKESLTPITLMKPEETICSTFNYLYGNHFGTTEASWKRVLMLYNKDICERDAILDIADFWAGRPNHGHYRGDRCPAARKKITKTSKAAV
jgi:hypothetical protein